MRYSARSTAVIGSPAPGRITSVDSGTATGSPTTTSGRAGCGSTTAQRRASWRRLRSVSAARSAAGCTGPATLSTRTTLYAGESGYSRCQVQMRRIVGASGDDADGEPDEIGAGGCDPAAAAASGRGAFPASAAGRAQSCSVTAFRSSVRDGSSRTIADIGTSAARSPLSRAISRAAASECPPAARNGWSGSTESPSSSSSWSASVHAARTRAAIASAGQRSSPITQRFLRPGPARSARTGPPCRWA